MLSEVDSFCETFGLEDNFLSEPVAKQGKTATPIVTPIANNNNQLPSVYESEDSELEDFLDDILERGRTLLKKTSKTSHGCNGSYAMDSRLEASVETSTEIVLRKLISSSTCNLIQNVNNATVSAESETELQQWPSNLLIPWQMQPQSMATNRKMLIDVFDTLFRELRGKPLGNLEHILQVLFLLLFFKIHVFL